MNLLLIKSAVSFLVAGVWITAATLYAEKAGSRMGGMFTNLPSNVLISLIFISLVNSPEYVVETTLSIPLGMLIGSCFLFIFILTLPLGILRAGAISLACWFIIAVLFSSLPASGMVVNILVYAFFTGILFIILEFGFRIRAMPNSKKSYSVRTLLLRALFAGSVVGTTVFISSFAPPRWVGIFSTFPAVLLSTMLILSFNQGADFAKATGKVLVLSSSNVVVYIVGVHLTYPVVGVFPGTLLSFAAAVGWILLIYPVLRRVR